jgi:hypothetical protein
MVAFPSVWIDQTPTRIAPIGAYGLSRTFMPARRCRNLARGRKRTTLAEHRGKPFKHPHPAMTHLPRQFRLGFVRQGELAASPARIERDGHTLEVQRIFLDGKREHESMRPNDFEIFADMLDILAMAPLHDVKPASGARIDLNAHDLSHRRRKQPFTCDPRIKPCIEDTLRRSPESATDAGIDTLLEANGNRHPLSSSSSNGGGPSSLMIDDKRQRALSSQIGHDLPRDLTLIAREVIAVDNIGRAQQRLFAFATLVRSCGKDFGIRPTSVRPLGQTRRQSPARAM